MARSIAETITSILRLILCFFALVISVVSLVFTVTTDYAESAFYCEFSQGILVFALASVLALVLAYIVRISGKLNRKHLLWFVAIASFLLSTVWMLSSRAIPDFDSFDLIGASRLDPLSGWWADGGYLERYPFQVPLVLLLAVLRQFVHSDAGVNIIFQGINCLAVSGSSVLLLLLAESIAPVAQQSVRLIAGVLILLFPPLFLYVTFVYGNMIALPFALAAFLLQIKGFSSHRMYLHFASGLCSVISIMLKSSMLLVVVAQCVVWVVASVKHRCIIYLMAGIFAVVLYKAVSSLTFMLVEAVVDIDLHNGVPQSAWLVMGIGADSLGESAYATLKPGWYSGYPWALPADQYDVELIKSQSYSLILDRLALFLQNPIFAIRFFAKKFIYEWAEPTYESIMMSNWSIAGPAGVAMATREVGRLAHSVYYGAAGYALRLQSDVMQLVIYTGALLAFIRYSKKMPIEIMGPALCAAGGGLFYVFWEAKSQYILPFALLLIPYAALGITSFIEKHPLIKLGRGGE